MNIQLLTILVAGHYVADFALQPKYMSQTKALTFIEDIGIHHLVAHGAVHGLMAGLLSHSFAVGVIVGLSHALIDFFRSSVLIRNLLSRKGLLKTKEDMLFGIHVDQFLHFLVILVIAWRLL